MRKIFKTALAITVAAAAILSVTSCAQEEPMEVMSFNEIRTAAEIVERINNMGEVSMENEAFIEDIYIDYTMLSDDEKEKVTNYDILDEARYAITKLYHTEEKDGVRIDRSKLLIGTYCFYNTSEERFQWLKDAGFDFVVGAPYNHDVLDLFSKYELGAFLAYLPSWYGDNGQHAGQYQYSVPSGAFDSYAANFVDHPAIWAVDVGDEPSALDFPHYGVMINEAKALFPNQLVYLNLYPIYASEEQQGTVTYEEHIQIYADNVDTDYISFDFYDIILKDINSKNGGQDYFLLRHIENLRIVANACREKGVDMWTVIQANALSDRPLDYLNEDQLNAQLYTCLAFGSQVINWACWENGWYDYNTNMITDTGERTPVYYEVAKVNANIKALSPVYMRYENTDAALLGNTSFIRGVDTSGDDNLNFLKTDGNVFEQEMFRNIEIPNRNAKVVAGSFVKRDGIGEAILFANTSYFFAKDRYSREDVTYDVNISFTLQDPDRKVIAYYPTFAFELEPDENGVYHLRLDNTDGVFITAEPVAEPVADTETEE